MDKDEAEIRIAYTGPAVKGGVMDARELADALTGLCGLFKHANELVTGRKNDVSVQVSTFKDGSFEFLLWLQQIMEAAPDFGMLADDLRNLQRVVKLLGMFRNHGGLLALYQWLGGQKPAETPTPVSGGKISLVREDGKTTTVLKEEYLLYTNPHIRRSVRNVVSPVYKNDGIDGMEIRSLEGGKLITRIDWQNVRYYHDFQNLDMATSKEREVRLYLVTVQLEGDGKWAFRHGGKGIIKAKMLDEKFSQKMDKTERFARGDMIRAKIREQKWVTGAKQPEYEIIEVLEHVEAYQQAHLPGMGGKEEAGE